MEIEKYFRKIEERPKDDLAWNIPERKQGKVNIIGGNVQNFKTVIKISESLGDEYPIEEVNVVLPDALRGQLPDLPNFKFLSSTESGSLANAGEIAKTINEVDFNLLIGDLSKNSVTEKTIASACESSEKPLLVTRDAVDLIASAGTEKVLLNEQTIFFASVAQLSKLLKSVYYPKMLLMSQSLVQVCDVLHKFTLSYPAKIITLHNEQILIASNGEARAVPLAKFGGSAFMIWSGELAVRIMVFNLYNPNNFLDASVAAIFG